MILTYREGTSGSWLAELITLGDNSSPVFYRQDYNAYGYNFPKNVFHFDGLMDNQTINVRRFYNDQPIITCHSTNYELLADLWPTHQIFRIHPKTGIYQCISAAFHKMEVGHNTANLAFEYIKHYHSMYNCDILPQYIIDYGMLSNLRYISNFSKDFFNFDLVDNHFNFFNDYWKIQKFVVDDTLLYNGISKNTLFNLFSKEDSVFNLACFIFAYENLNNIQESQRKWSIDNVPSNLTELVEIMVYE